MADIAIVPMRGQELELCALKSVFAVARSLTGGWQIGHTVSGEVRSLADTQLGDEWEADE